MAYEENLMYFFEMGDRVKLIADQERKGNVTRIRPSAKASERVEVTWDDGTTSKHSHNALLDCFDPKPKQASIS